VAIGLDLGDLWWVYCVRDEAGHVILKQKLPTTSLGRDGDAPQYGHEPLGGSERSGMHARAKTFNNLQA